MIKLRYPTYVPFTLKQASLVLVGLAFLVVVQQFIDHLSSGYIYDFSWGLVILKNLSAYLLWLGVIPVVVKVINYYVTNNRNQAYKWTVLITSLLVLAFLQRAFAIILFDTFYGIALQVKVNLFRVQNSTALWAGSFSSFLQVSALTGIIWGIINYKRILLQQKALTEAELRALKMQLRPHFLFNTFHSIAALIDIDTNAAQIMLSRLSSMLRALLEKEKEQKITLGEEIEFIRNYLGIEQVRFQDRLQIDFKLNPDTLQAEVPTFILQPIAENALKHGISHLTHNGQITVGSERIGRHTLKIWVEDNGPGNTQVVKGFGVGLSNTQQRLEQLYGKSYHFEMLKPEKGGFRVTLLIPFQTLQTSIYANPDLDNR